MPDPMPFPDAARDAILGWYGVGGRTLPFRGTTDPYAVLVSEAMAQQTQAARAGEAWTRFMAAFPTVVSLAAATPADVLRAWQGLGYNRRALHLWQAARKIVEIYGGAVPADLAALEELPGVGPYTARAVAAIAFGMPVGAVDTNVRRVIGRIVAGDPGALDSASLQATADAAVAGDRPADWTHAVMDLGATLCVARRPSCGACPVRHWCRFAAAAAAGAGPTGDAPPSPGVRRPRSAQPIVVVGALHQAGEQPPPSRTNPRFRETTRWLRGRIIDRLRVAGDDWSVIEAPIGAHDADAVWSALDGLAREGLVELDRTSRPGRQLARLPVA